MKMDSDRPLFVCRIRPSYRFIVYGAIAALSLAFYYAFSADDPADRVEHLYNPYLWIFLIVILTSVLHVESRKITLWADRFCDSKFIFLSKCFAYAEIARISSETQDGYFLIVLRDGTTLHLPEFLMNPSRELEQLGDDLRGFLESKVGA